MLSIPAADRAFTLTELLVVLGITGLLAAVLVPAVVTSRRQAQASACLSNLKQLSVATVSYVRDYDGGYRPVISATFENNSATQTGIAFWYDLLLPYTQSQRLVCPSRQVSEANAKEVYAGATSLMAN